MNFGGQKPLGLRRPRRGFMPNERDEGVASPVKIAAAGYDPKPTCKNTLHAAIPIKMIVSH